MVQVIVCGNFALFSLVMGPLFLTGAMKTADGRPATEAGIAPSIFGVVFSLFTALALFRATALRRPLVRLCREGIVVRLIGATTLDDLPEEIPVFGKGIKLLRLAWSIASLQGFKQQLVYAPWEGFQEAQVWGLAMQRKLTIFALFFHRSSADRQPQPDRWPDMEQC